MNIIKLKKVLKGDRTFDVFHKEMDPMKSKERKWDHQGALPKASAVLILLHDDGGEWKFPLIQRPTYDGTHSGQVSLPGGKYEEEDRNLINTAKRETFEEIGVPSEMVNVLGELSQLYVPPSNFNILPVVGMACEPLDLKIDLREVEEVYHILVKDLLNRDLRKQKKVKVGSNVKISVPCFEFGDVTVWGATAMILSEFAGILETMENE